MTPVHARGRSIALILLPLALAACAPHVAPPQASPGGTAPITHLPSCGAGNPACAPGGRPRVIILPGGTTGIAPSGYVMPKGGG